MLMKYFTGWLTTNLDEPCTRYHEIRNDQYKSFELSRLADGYLLEPDHIVRTR